MIITSSPPADLFFFLAQDWYWKSVVGLLITSGILDWHRSTLQRKSNLETLPVSQWFRSSYRHKKLWLSKKWMRCKVQMISENLHHKIREWEIRSMRWFTAVCRKGSVIRTSVPHLAPRCYLCSRRAKSDPIYSAAYWEI